MLSNFFKIAIRNFRRNLLFSLINVIGLAIGISAAMVIYLIVHYDFSFDRFHADGSRIYRIVSVMHFPGQEIKNSGVPMPMSAALQQEATGLSAVAPFYIASNFSKVSVPQQAPAVKRFIDQSHIIYADSRYFKVFGYQWLAGSPASLNQPFKTVLTASQVKDYFGNIRPADAIGRTLIYGDSTKATVSGVVADLTENTDFTFKQFISYSTIENSSFKHSVGWGNWSSINGDCQLFVKLNANVSPAAIEKQLIVLHQKNVQNDPLKPGYTLQSLSDLHFNREYDNFAQRQASKPILYGLLVVAAILLLLGCINFVNLTTARAVYRAKEIGVRKTMGSSKGQLVAQFISETLVITAAATVLSLLLVPFLLRIFAGFIPPGLRFDLLHQPYLVVFILGLMLVVGIVAGFYPALVLTRFNPVTALKNQTSASGGKSRSAWLRQSLTVVQFVAAQALIVATLIVSRQIHYVLNKDLGFAREGIVTMDVPFDFSKQAADKARALLHRIQALPQVDAVAFAGAAPVVNGYSSSVLQYTDGKKSLATTVETKYADNAYFQLYRMKLLAGRFPQPNDSLREMVINENFSRFLGFKHPEDAIGKQISMGNKRVPVVGVMADFYYSSLHKSIKPLAYMAINGNYSTLHIRLKPAAGDENWKAAIGGMQSAWKNIYPDEGFSYKFLNDTIGHFYKSEQNTSKLLNWATGLTILISCMGLLGLVIHTTTQRTKEIGVRKVLGASVTRIVALLSFDFLRLVLVAVLIASPLAWWAMGKWLQNFAYRTTLNWWILAAAGGAALIIAFITISFQSVKAALANPVDSLRSE